MPLTQAEQEELDVLKRLEEAGAFLSREVAPLDIQTTPPTLPQVAKGVVTAIPKALAASKFDIAGSVAGGLAGARLGAPGGPSGVVAGGIIGGVAGGTLGKKADVLAGTRDPQSTLTQIGISTAEEAFGRALVPVVSKTAEITGINKLFGAIGERTGLSRAPKTIEDLKLTASDIDPQITGATIDEAQENILGDQLLTVFETTGGRAGQSLQALLDGSVQKARGTSDLASDFLATRTKIRDKITAALKGKNIEKSNEALSDSVKAGFTALQKHLGDQLGAIEKKLVIPRKKVIIKSKIVDEDGVLQTIDSELGAAMPFLQAKLTDEQISKLTEVTHKFFAHPDGPRTGFVFKDSFRMDDLVRYENEVQDIIGKFSDNQNVQNKIAGVYSAHIRPIFEKRLAAAKVGASEADSRVFDLQAQFDALAKQKAMFEKSRVGKLIGLAKTKQLVTAKESSKLEAIIFDSPQTWKETQEMFDALGMPEMSERLAEKFKANFTKNSFDPKKGEFTFSKIDGQIKKFGEDLIREVAGEAYLRSAKDSRLISLALDQTAPLVKGKTALSPSQLLFENMRRMFVHPLAGRVGFVQGIMTKLRGAIGLGNVTDKHIFKLMQGERGQALVEKAINSPLADPRSYNIYVQFVREFEKLGVDVTLLDRESYFNGVINGLTTVMDSLDSQGINVQEQ